jgi:hypothetical protein
MVTKKKCNTSWIWVSTPTTTCQKVTQRTTDLPAAGREYTEGHRENTPDQFNQLLSHFAGFRFSRYAGLRSLRSLRLHLLPSAFCLQPFLPIAY